MTAHTITSCALTRRNFVLGAVAAAAGFAAHSASSVARVIVPFAAGGAREVPIRIIQQELNAATDQNWIIESKPGAGGAIGTSYVAKAPGDGLTLLMAASSHFVTAAMGAKPAYDPIKDFTPVAMLGEQSYVLLVHSALPVKTVSDLIQYAKARPGELTYASAGVASSTHLAGAYFASLAGLQMLHVPYKSTQEAANDVVAGRAHLTFVPASGLGPYLSDKRLNVMAITAAQRSSTLPQLPTFVESGLPKYVFESWFGLLAPAQIPAAASTKIHAAVNKALAQKSIQERMQTAGIEVAPMSQADFQALFLADQKLMARICQESGISRD